MAASIHPSITRRQLLLTGAMTALTAPHVVAQSATPAPPASPTAGRFLLISRDEPASPVSVIEAFAPDMTSLGRHAFNTVIATVEGTAVPGRAAINTVDGGVLLDIPTMQPVDIRWNDGPRTWYALRSPIDPNAWATPWMIFGTMDFDGVLAINAETGVGEDITSFVQDDPQAFIPTSDAYSEDGSWVGIWTGNNVYLAETGRFSTARKLNGDDPAMWSTNFSIDPTNTWVSYTTYDQQSEAPGAVYLERTDGSTLISVVESNAWGQIIFCPNGGFLLIANGAIELRHLDDPTAPGRQLATAGQLTYYRTIWSPDRTILYVATTDTAWEDMVWTQITITTGETRTIDEITGMAPQIDDRPNATPRWMVMATIGNGDSSTPITFTTLDLATGAARPLMADIQLDAFEPISSSDDGRIVAWVTANRGETRGGFIANQQTGDITPLPWGNGEYTLAAEISGAGDICVFSMVLRPSNEVVTAWSPVDNLSARHDLGLGAVLGWV